MARGRMLAALGLALLGAAPGAPGQTAPGADSRTRLYLGAGASIGGPDYDEQRPIEEYAETGQISARYSTETGPVLELALGRRLSRRFGAFLGFAAARRDASAAYEAALPHPLYLDRDRAASGSLSGLEYEEREGWLDLSWGGSSGRLDLLLFAGLTLLQLETELLGEIRYDHEYPYDSVRVREEGRLKANDTALGWNAGAGLDVRLSRRLALGALARYVRAGAELVPATGTTVEVDAGGLRLTGGVRLLF